jgi:hypothetical protein
MFLGSTNGLSQNDFIAVLKKIGNNPAATESQIICCLLLNYKARAK